MDQTRKSSAVNKKSAQIVFMFDPVTKQKITQNSLVEIKGNPLGNSGFMTLTRKSAPFHDPLIFREPRAGKEPPETNNMLVFLEIEREGDHTFLGQAASSGELTGPTEKRELRCLKCWSVWAFQEGLYAGFQNMKPESSNHGLRVPPFNGPILTLLNRISWANLCS